MQKEDVVVDAVGLFCPEPILMLSEEMEKIDSGMNLLLMLDDPSGKEDVERWAKRTENTILETREDGGEMHFLIQKKG